MFLFDIVARKDILPDQMKKCTLSLEEQSTNLQSYFDNEISTFHEIYKAYLDDISVEECAQLKVPQLINVFRKSKTESNVIVKGLADEFRKIRQKQRCLVYGGKRLVQRHQENGLLSIELLSYV